MHYFRRNLRLSLLGTVGAALWLMMEQTASAQALLAQTGGAKTGIGWLIVLLCVGLGLIAVLRPGVRDKRPKWGKK